MKFVKRRYFLTTLALGVTFHIFFYTLNGCNAGPERPPLPDKEEVDSDLKLSSNIPSEVTFTTSVSSPQEARPFFDQFSWNTFIALNWPAIVSDSVRGVAKDPNQIGKFRKTAKPGNPYTAVWQTYKSADELFGQGANRPTPWNSSVVAQTPCESGSNQFSMIAKGGNVFSDINESLAYPLIDQNKNYVYFNVRYNEVQYNFVRGEDDNTSTWLYLRRNLTENINMPASTKDKVGSMMLKSAWKILSPEEIASQKFFMTQASIVTDPNTGACDTTNTLGLVAMHIAQKVDSFPEWVWSTFEHIDNVPGDNPHATSYSFNNGTDSPSTLDNGFANKPPNKSPDLQPKDERIPVQVTRFNKVPTSTQETNQKYQKALKGTVWENYLLVFTQWPTQPKTFAIYQSTLPNFEQATYPKYSGSPFPQDSVTNTVIETYFQSSASAIGAFGNSCMSCHYQGASQYDFSWSLINRSYSINGG